MEDVASFYYMANLRRMYETKNNNNNDNKLFDLCYDFCYILLLMLFAVAFLLLFVRMLECMRLFVRLSMKLFRYIYIILPLCIANDKNNIFLTKKYFFLLSVFLICFIRIKKDKLQLPLYFVMASIGLTEFIL